MSRTNNTAPLRVQAWSLPAWASTVSHSFECARGVSPCSLDRAVDVAGTEDPRGRCTRWALYYWGPVGGTRRNQGEYSNMNEREVRADARTQLRAAVKAANSAGGERFDDGTFEEMWDIAVDVHPRPVAWWIW